MKIIKNIKPFLFYIMNVRTNITYHFLTPKVNGSRIKAINIYILDKRQKLHCVKEEDYANGYYLVNVIVFFKSTL